MTDQTETKPRESLLDAFSRVIEDNGSRNEVAVSAPLPVERIVGAQKVAVYRDDKKVLERIRLFAASAGQDWYYRFPVKKRGGGQEFIEGPSIKLANTIARVYGNCEVDTRVQDLGDSWLFYARFTDFETGFTMTRPFQQRKGQRGMKTEFDRALDIAFQIGASKAIRNVIVNSLQSVADYAFEEARNALVERVGKNLEGYRQKTLQRLAEMKITLPRAERVIARPAKDWTAPDVSMVIAMIQSIQDGMATIDDTFPEHDDDGVVDEPENKEEQKTDTPQGNTKLDDLALKDQSQPEPKTKEEYMAYAKRMVERTDVDIKFLNRWIGSNEQNALRKTCGVDAQDVMKLRAWIDAKKPNET